MVGATNLNKRRVNTNKEYYILVNSAMPTLLIEMGVITNPSDAELFSTRPEIFAEGIYNGILEYFGLLPNTPAEE